MGFPKNHGQVNRSHAMTLRLLIHDQSNQDTALIQTSSRGLPGSCLDS